MSAHIPPQAPLSCALDNGFTEWLAGSGGSLAISTYQANKLLLVSWNGQQISFLPRHFDKPMGLDLDGDRLVLASRHALWRFADAQPLAYRYREPGRYDSLYLPVAIHPMPDLNIHDLAMAGEEVWMAVTRLSCLATLSSHHTVQPRWRPPFISQLAPEDRCHLNGLALVDGRPRWVTALGTTDQAGAWREHKLTGGVVMDVDSSEIVARGFAMPHSPRWHDGRLWLLDSGKGELITLDPANGQSTTVCALPGFLRGLTFAGGHALVGLSMIREAHIFGGMPVLARYPELLCGVAVVDLASGRQVGMLRFTSGCSELYDLRFLPGRRRPNILNLEREDVTQALYVPDCNYWLRPEFEIH